MTTRYARYETLDGYTVIYDPDRGAYVYAHTDGSGAERRFVSSGVLLSEPPPEGLARHLREGQLYRREVVKGRMMEMLPEEETGRDRPRVVAHLRPGQGPAPWLHPDERRCPGSDDPGRLPGHADGGDRRRRLRPAEQPQFHRQRQSVLREGVLPHDVDGPAQVHQHRRRPAPHEPAPARVRAQAEPGQARTGGSPGGCGRRCGLQPLRLPRTGRRRLRVHHLRGADGVPGGPLAAQLAFPLRDRRRTDGLLHRHEHR